MSGPVSMRRDGGDRRHRRRQSARQRAQARSARRHLAMFHRGARRQQRRGDRAHRRGPHLHGRRRHHRIRQAAAAARASIEVIAAIEKIQKPTIAAVHGTPLGGGLEMTLACHFRVAAPGTRLGLPEIKLGIIPGAGGTQRLPRLVGVEKALAMILRGDPIPAKDALALGLDRRDHRGRSRRRRGRVRASGHRREAAAAARARHRRQDRDRCARTRTNSTSAAANVAKKLARAAGAARRDRGGALRRSTCRSTTALKREREMFMKLRRRRAVEGAAPYFLRRARGREDPGHARRTLKPREIKRAAVIGAGTMGGGIAMSFANAGIPVTVIETADEALKRGLDTDREELSDQCQRGASKPTRWSASASRCSTARLDGGGEGRRHRDRGGVRGNGHQEAGVRRARQARQAERGARHQHLLSRRRRDRADHQAADSSARHAFLQPRQRDEAAGDRARQGDGARRARDRDGGRPQDRQGAGGGRRLPRLRRQPHAGARGNRGGAAAARGRAAAATSTARSPNSASRWGRSR